MSRGFANPDNDLDLWNGVSYKVSVAPVVEWVAITRKC